MIENTAKKIHVSESCLSDFYKDAYGIRPRGYYKEWWSREELDAEISHLCEVTRQNEAREAVHEAAMLVEFENRISEVIKLGAENRKTAIRWLMDAENVDFDNYQDIEHFFWKQNIGWQAIKKFTDQFDNTRTFVDTDETGANVYR